METLGSRVAVYRAAHKWTQERLASEISITQSLLSDIENDKISPKWDIINKIAEKLEVAVIKLLPIDANIMYNQYIDPSHPGYFIQSGDLMTHNNNEAEELLWQQLLKTKDELIKAKEEIIEALKKMK